MARIRVAIVGCGRISPNHFRAVKEHSADFELCGACDVDANARRAAAKEYGTDEYASLTDLLAVAKPDLVSLCTPSGLHPWQAIEAARAGVNVLSEKPMATRHEHAVQAIQECDRAGVRLFVVKQNRLNATIQSLKRAIDKGRFGRISVVTSNVFWTRPQDYYDQAKWRGTWELDGGAFMNQASHYVDMLTYLFGPIETVHSFAGTLGRKIEAEDCGVLAVKWRSGAMGTMNVSMLTWPKNFEGSLTVIGEKGTVRIGGVALNRIEAWQFETPDAEDDAAALGASYETTSVYGFGHSGYYKELAKALRGEPSLAVTGREGLVSLQTLVGAYRSAISGKPVGFPLGM